MDVGLSMQYGDTAPATPYDGREHLPMDSEQLLKCKKCRLATRSMMIN